MRFNLILSSIIALAATLAVATPVAKPRGGLDVRVDAASVVKRISPRCLGKGCAPEVIGVPW
ncbi:hypothetical protein FB45DRAFT_1030927 [Roridomyces roridus]|uniref:Uncharacterized protein n=1 Tax=Roridomyces roridus TaxID=1738132 RepID=A0AAD7FHR9_9AGAR|nr:hypothetical protein FB45DRAFT_1030927 [Roridomyces roridus]